MRRYTRDRSLRSNHTEVAADRIAISVVGTLRRQCRASALTVEEMPYRWMWGRASFYSLSRMLWAYAETVLQFCRHKMSIQLYHPSVTCTRSQNILGKPKSSLLTNAIGVEEMVDIVIHGAGIPPLKPKNEGLFMTSRILSVVV